MGTHILVHPPPASSQSHFFRVEFVQISVASLQDSPAPLHGCTPIRLNWRSLPLTSLPHPSVPGGTPLPSPPPLLQSFFWHFSSFCHLRGPAECEVLLWCKWGISPKLPTGHHVFHEKATEYFLIVLRCFSLLKFHFQTSILESRVSMSPLLIQPRQKERSFYLQDLLKLHPSRVVCACAV